MATKSDPVENQSSIEGDVVNETIGRQEGEVGIPIWESDTEERKNGQAHKTGLKQDRQQAKASISANKSVPEKSQEAKSVSAEKDSANKSQSVAKVMHNTIREQAVTAKDKIPMKMTNLTESTSVDQPPYHSTIEATVDRKRTRWRPHEGAKRTRSRDLQRTEAIDEEQSKRPRVLDVQGCNREATIKKTSGKPTKIKTRSQQMSEIPLT